MVYVQKITNVMLLKSGLYSSDDLIAITLGRIYYPSYLADCSHPMNKQAKSHNEVILTLLHIQN